MNLDDSQLKAHDSSFLETQDLQMLSSYHAESSEFEDNPVRGTEHQESKKQFSSQLKNFLKDKEVSDKVK